MAHIREMAMEHQRKESKWMPVVGEISAEELDKPILFHQSFKTEILADSRCGISVEFFPLEFLPICFGGRYPGDG